MTRGLLKRATWAWLGLFVLAFVNGALREAVIKPLVGEPLAHQLSAATAILIFSGYVWLIWPRIRIGPAREAMSVGLYWLLMTLVVETFVLNRWMSKLSWDQILEAYRIDQGQLWGLVVLWIGALPLILRALKSPGSEVRSGLREELP